MAWLLKKEDHSNRTKEVIETDNSTTGAGSATELSQPLQEPQERPEWADAAAVLIGQTSLYVFRVRKRSDYESCQRFTGPGYAFLELAINNQKGSDKFTWHCWTNGVLVNTSDGKVSKSIDLSDMNGFFSWELSGKFPCVRTVYPGRLEGAYLAFYPGFSWSDVRSVSINAGGLGEDYQAAQWIQMDK